MTEPRMDDLLRRLKFVTLRTAFNEREMMTYQRIEVPCIDLKSFRDGTRKRTRQADQERSAKTWSAPPKVEIERVERNGEATAGIANDIWVARQILRHRPRSHAIQLNSGV